MTRFLDPLDSAFVLLETAGTAMNIGAVIELDTGDTQDPQTRYESIRQNISDRLHEIPVLTQRVVRAPFDLTWPVLVPDEQFSLDSHVVRLALPSPGSADQFDAAVAEFLSRPLSPRRPLWQLLVIEGLDNDTTAVVFKIHHGLADGVSGAATFANLFDISSAVRSPAPASAPGPSAADDSNVSSPWGLVRDRLELMGRRPRLVLENLGSWVVRCGAVLRMLVRVMARGGLQHTTSSQPSIFEARRTSLNGAPGVEKAFHRLRVPLADVKRVARSHDASVTDFVITVAGGALRRLLEDRGEFVSKDLIACVPINVRAEGATSDLGNQFSAMLVSLRTGILDPAQRLAAIARDSTATVGVQRTSAAQLLQDIPRVLGPMVLSLGAKLMSSLDLFDRLPPVANLMLSSVPGPPIPLWLSGRRVVSAAPVGPLLASLSLNITALGIGDSLEFGLLGCVERMPDLATLRDYVHDEATKLLASSAQ